MMVLVVGASGATGRLVVSQMLDNGLSVRALVRVGSNGLDSVDGHSNLSIVRGNLLDLTEEETTQLVHGCVAIVSCLGHSLNFKGLFGQPRRLVREAARKLCASVASVPDQPKIKYILMNTAGVSNRDLSEPISTGQKVVIGLLKALLPPHADNESAADYLRETIGQNHLCIEWVAVRPDTLTNETEVSAYELHPSPNRSAIFNPGKTSRINVANFMMNLVMDQGLWTQWCGKMPVIYNKEASDI